VAGQRGVVLRRASGWPVLRGEGVSPSLRPLPDHRREAVVEVEPDAGRVPGGDKERHCDDGDGHEEARAAVVGVSLSHDVEHGWPAARGGVQGPQERWAGVVVRLVGLERTESDMFRWREGRGGRGPAGTSQSLRCWGVAGVNGAERTGGVGWPPCGRRRRWWTWRGSGSRVVSA